MKIGLLECDHVGEQFLAIAGDYREMFPALFPDLEFELFDLINGHFPDSVARCDAYMCTGSRFSVYDDIGWIKWLKAFVGQLHQAGKPFVGVCFGHQMMAEALGGKVEKAKVGWCVGAHSFTLLNKTSWMAPPAESFRLLMLCQDQVVELPPDSQVLAKTTDCPVGLFTVGNNMLGVQAHPEFPKAYLEAILQDRRQRIGQAKTEAALSSLGPPLDTPMLVKWIVRFLEQALR